MKSSKSYSNFFSRPSGDKSEDIFCVSLSAVGTFPDNDLASKQERFSVNSPYRVRVFIPVSHTLVSLKVRCT